MPFEWAQYQKKPPVAQTRMGKAALRAEKRMVSEELANGFHRIEIMIGSLQTSMDDVALVLPFHVRNEVVRLADIHAAENAEVR